MKTLNRSSKGFTLVEIMIVVVIIGLLAAMAIPAFQKVRRDSIKKTIVNDARLVANAAQQYFMEKGVTTVPVTVLVGTATSNYVKAFSRGNTINTTAMISENTFTFAMQNSLIGTSSMTFDNEGKITGTGDPY
jgi:type IV pilus assembly protein PilA